MFLTIKEIQSKYDTLKGKYDDISICIEENQNELKVNKIKLEKLMICNKLLSYISQNNQEKVVKLFEFTLSSALKDLFDQSYEFGFELKTRGDSSACDFVIQSNAFPGWSNIVMCRGRSVAEIVSTIFRLVLVKLSKKNRKILILDEPSGGIQVERQKLFSEFLSKISKKFGIQLIVVTHSPELCENADSIIDLDKVKNVRS